MTPSPAQQQVSLSSSHHCIDNGGSDSPAIMTTTTTTTTTSAIPSSFQQPDVLQPRDPTHHDNHHTQPHSRNQRSHSVNALPSDLQQQQHEHKQRLSSHEEEQPHQQPWWQYYYQLYHYHPPQGRKPTVFGPYLLLQTLGEGEFGKVKLAVHIKTGQEVSCLGLVYVCSEYALIMILLGGHQVD